MSNNGPRLEQGRNDTIAEIKAACDRLQLDAEESSLFHSHGRAELDLAIVLRAARDWAWARGSRGSDLESIKMDKDRIYVRDVCRRCGETVERAS